VSRLAFRQSDVKRALDIAEERGMKIRGYTLGPDGAITVLTADREPRLASDPDEEAANPWDTVLRGAA
jgi:hypothetical protein